VDCIVCGAAVDAKACLRWQKDGFDILRCPSCGLVFRAVLPELRELDEIYAEQYFRADAAESGGQGYADYVGDEELHRESARERLRLLARHIAPNGLLDVGAAAGFFVDEATGAGWSARGIDIAPSMVAWGREQLGARVELSTLADYDVEPDSLTAVTMWDYIEHSVDPAGDVNAAFRLLRPGGVLALSTGDVESRVSRVSGRRWHLLTPRHHNFFFSARTLGRLLESAGFGVVWRGYPGHRYTLRYVAHKSRTMIDVAPVRAVSRSLDSARLGAVRIPVNLFDIVTMIARKPSAA
jgi:SAM-dependent methyltransferase